MEMGRYSDLRDMGEIDGDLGRYRDGEIWER